MLAMKTASDNAQDLLKDLQLEYNKARRKLIDKKIQEVQAGRSLWA
jgi:F-type H+-transporting ATPase subunit gamma